MVSPLLGLLGTVLGLITSLSSLQIGNLEASQTTGVTGGIGEALTSTATGLVVAIVTLFFASTFRGLYLQQIALIQEFSSQLELLHLDRYEQPGDISNADYRMNPIAHRKLILYPMIGCYLCDSSLLYYL